MNRSDPRVWLAMAVVLAPVSAWAASPFAPGGTFGWLLPMFHPRYPTAFDYILLVVGLIVGAAVAVFYYRAVLLEAVKAMQKPAGVKVRAAGVGLLVAALIMMLSPNLPIGWLMLVALAGAIMAASFGLSILIAIALVVAVVVLVVLKIMHVF
jgi:hypothetical protein